MTTFEGTPSLEHQPVFNWRNYIRSPELLPTTICEKLDAITSQLNDQNDTEMVAIKKELEEGIADRSFRSPVGSLINMFRPYLSTEEKTQLNNAVRDAGDWNPVR